MGSVLSSLALVTLSTTATLAELDSANLDPKPLLKSVQIACTIAQLVRWIPYPYLIPTFAVSLLAMPITASFFNDALGFKNGALEKITSCASIISKIAFCILVPLSLSACHPVLASFVFFGLVVTHIFTLFPGVTARRA